MAEEPRSSCLAAIELDAMHVKAMCTRYALSRQTTQRGTRDTVSEVSVS